MKITCQELEAVSNQNDVQATLSDVQKVTVETPDEIKVIVETVGWAQLLEEIGIDRAMKHFGIKTENDEQENEDANN